jgi:hypothetical protein
MNMDDIERLSPLGKAQVKYRDEAGRVSAIGLSQKGARQPRLMHGFPATQYARCIQIDRRYPLNTEFHSQVEVSLLGKLAGGLVILIPDPHSSSLYSLFRAA